MHARLRRPAVALITTTLAASVLGIAPAAEAVGDTLSGTVTGSESATGLPDVQVAIFEYNTGDSYWEPIDYASTNDDGFYSIALADGDYRVGFSEYNGHIAEYYENVDDVEDATTVQVSSASPAVVNAALDPGAHVTGVVSGAGAGLLPEMEVTAYEPVVDDGETYYDEVGYDITDSNGAYDIGGLPSGDYVVGFSDLNYFDDATEWAAEYYNDVTNAAEADLVSVTAPLTTEHIDAVLGPDAQFSGTVTDGNGVGMQGYIQAYSLVGQEWEYVESAYSASNGTYVLEGLRPGIYRVELYGWVGGEYADEFWNEKGRIEKANDVVVTASTPLTDINATLVPGEHDSDYVVQNTALPTISGAPVVGQTLTASTGSWSPTATEFYYDWLRDGQFIGDAFGSTYVPTTEDIGHTISVLVTAGADNYDYGHAESAQTAPVSAPVVTSPVVTPPAPVVDVPTALAKALATLEVTGKLKVGKTVKVAHLDLDVRTAVTYRFQWFAGTKKIKKATKSKLKVLSSMRGKKLSVKVTGTAGSTSKSVKLKVGKVR